VSNLLTSTDNGLAREAADFFHASSEYLFPLLFKSCSFSLGKGQKPERFKPPLQCFAYLKPTKQSFLKPASATTIRSFALAHPQPGPMTP
jgi:hypothetical protein